MEPVQHSDQRLSQSWCRARNLEDLLRPWSFFHNGDYGDNRAGSSPPRSGASALRSTDVRRRRTRPSPLAPDCSASSDIRTSVHVSLVDTYSAARLQARNLPDLRKNRQAAYAGGLSLIRHGAERATARRFRPGKLALRGNQNVAQDDSFGRRVSTRTGWASIRGGSTAASSTSARCKQQGCKSARNTNSHRDALPLFARRKELPVAGLKFFYSTATRQSGKPGSAIERRTW